MEKMEKGMDNEYNIRNNKTEVIFQCDRVEYTRDSLTVNNGTLADGKSQRKSELGLSKQKQRLTRSLVK